LKKPKDEGSDSIAKTLELLERLDYAQRQNELDNNKKNRFEDRIKRSEWRDNGVQNKIA